MRFKSQKEKMIALANLMNEGSETPLMATDDLLYAIDAALVRGRLPCKKAWEIKGSNRTGLPLGSCSGFAHRSQASDGISTI